MSRVALNGFALINDYEQERDGKISFSGHGVFTYDPKEDSYMLVWVDCMGAPPEIFKGQFEGDVLKLAHGGLECMSALPTTCRSRDFFPRAWRCRRT